MNVEMLLVYKKWVAEATHRYCSWRTSERRTNLILDGAGLSCTTSSTRKIHGQQLLRAASHICRI